MKYADRSKPYACRNCDLCSHRETCFNKGRCPKFNDLERYGRIDFKMKDELKIHED